MMIQKKIKKLSLALAILLGLVGCSEKQELSKSNNDVLLLDKNSSQEMSLAVTVQSSSVIWANIRGVIPTYQITDQVKNRGKEGCAAATANTVLSFSNLAYKGGTDGYLRAVASMGVNSSYAQIVAYLSKCGAVGGNMVQSGLSNSSADKAIAAITSSLKRNNAVIALVYAQGSTEGGLVSKNGWAHWVGIVGIDTRQGLVYYYDPLSKLGLVKSISIANLKSSWLGSANAGSYAFKNVNLIEVSNQQLLLPIEDLRVKANKLTNRVQFDFSLPTDATDVRVQVALPREAYSFKDGFVKTVVNLTFRTADLVKTNDRYFLQVNGALIPISGTYMASIRFNRSSVSRHSEFSLPVSFNK